jgi:dephospho-CoA kinase
MNKLICLVGMPGAGKSAVSEYLMSKRGFGYFRFGQIVLDKVKETGLPTSEKLEREVREKIRADHGMAAMAILNLPKIEKLINAGDVIGDGLYSWEEYIYLKEKFGDRLIIIAIFTPPQIRYARLENRAAKHGADPELKFRSFSQAESKVRDYAEIENSHKAGPIAMADYTLINISTVENLNKQIDSILLEIFSK